MKPIDADALKEQTTKRNSIWDSVSDIYGRGLTEIIDSMPTIEERKKGKWDERSVFDAEDSGIAQMQSAKCSVCGKYHTTPYLYFFDNFNFCPNCGARMVDDDIS